MPRLAANLTMMFAEWGFLDRFAASADAGFGAVEFLFPYEYPAAEIAARLRQNGLKLAIFNLPPGNWAAGERGMAALPERRDEFRASVAKALSYAQDLGVERLHVMSGLADRARPSALASYRDAISFACAAAAKHQIAIMIEPINGRDMPGYFLNNFDFATELIRDLGAPNLRLQYDIYHRQILHGDVMKSLEALMPLIGHVQIAAVPLRHEPFSGELDDGRVLGHLDALGYAGYVGLEYRPANGTLAGLSWRDRLKGAQPSS